MCLVWHFDDLLVFKRILFSHILKTQVLKKHSAFAYCAACAIHYHRIMCAEHIVIQMVREGEREGR